MEIEASRSTLPDSSFSTMSSSSARAVSKLIALIAVFSFAIVVLIIRDPRQEVAAAPDQCLDMDADRSGQSPDVIAALEHRYNAAFGVLVGNLHEVERRPDEILFGEIEPAQGIGAMGVETRRNDQKVGSEGVESGQDDGRHRIAEFRTAITFVQGSIEDIADPGFRRGPGAGIKRHLMGRAVEQVF